MPEIEIDFEFKDLETERRQLTARLLEFSRLLSAANPVRMITADNFDTYDLNPDPAPASAVDVRGIALEMMEIKKQLNETNLLIAEQRRVFARYCEQRDALDNSEIVGGNQP